MNSRGKSNNPKSDPKEESKPKDDQKSKGAKFGAYLCDFFSSTHLANLSTVKVVNGGRTHITESGSHGNRADGNRNL
jgi:hypothetical protein